MNKYNYVSNSANGHEAHDVLQNKLLELRRIGDLSIVVKTYRAGDPKAKNAGQFYAPFMIQFNNGARWIIFSTTSCRTDRIKGQQWDAENLKRLDPLIEKAILTYPDDVKRGDELAFAKQKNKYDTGLEVSSLDDILSNKLLIEQIQCRAFDIYHEREDNDNDALMSDVFEEATKIKTEQLSLFEHVGNRNESVNSIKEEGRLYDFDGREFEKDIAILLADAVYLEKLKRGEAMGCDRKFSCFMSMIKTFGINPLHIISIKATAKKEDIGLLPSGGQPKTDVWATFSLEGGEKKDITISCKRTTKSIVTAHQYSADVFADVLDLNNDSLRALLNVFQFYANVRDMPEGDRIALEEHLHSLLPRLCKWVLGGYGGECSSPIQYADYLVVYNPIDGYFGVHSIDEYTEILLRQTPKTFGTPFGWTYASKQRQRSIQLKLPIIR